MHKTVHTQNAPAALGPYSQGIDTGRALFLSGQIPLDPATGAIAGTGIEEQTRRAIQNLSAVLAQAGLSLSDVVKTTVFMADLGEFAAMNAVYAEMFGDTKPARSAVQVAALPKGAKIEIEAIAVRP